MLCSVRARSCPEHRTIRPDSLTRNTGSATHPLPETRSTVATASAGSLELRQVTGWLLVGTGQRAMLVGPPSEVTQAWVQILAPPLESYFISQSLSLAIKQGPRRCCEFTTTENGGRYCCCHHPLGGSLPSYPQHILTS